MRYIHCYEDPVSLYKDNSKKQKKAFYCITGHGYLLR